MLASTTETIDQLRLKINPMSKSQSGRYANLWPESYGDNSRLIASSVEVDLRVVLDDVSNLTAAVN